MTITRKFIGAVATAAALALTLAGCSAPSDAELGSAERPVKIGVVGASEPYWKTYTEAATEAGIAIELVNYTSYDKVNPALSNGDLDLNQFQHVVYLAQYNVAASDDLAPIGSTAIYPLGLYSSKYDDVAEIPEGETVAVANDESNQARGLLILQSAGLIEITGGGSPFSTVADVDEAASKVTVQAIDPALAVGSLPDYAGAVLNNDFVIKGGLNFDDALAQDDAADPSAKAYINVWAARDEDKDNATLAKLVALFQDTPAVTEGLQEVSGGVAEILNETPAALSDLLATTQKQVEEARSR